MPQLAWGFLLYEGGKNDHCKTNACVNDAAIIC